MPANQRLCNNCNAEGNITVVEDITDVSSPSVNPTNMYILQNLMEYLKYLDDDQGTDMEHLLNLHSQVTSNVPGFCAAILQDAELVFNDIFPIRQSAYWDNPRKGT